MSPQVAGRRPERLHVDFVDGLRGLSAFYVLLHHVWQFSITDPRSPAPRWFGVASVFKYGSYAVAVFIVISGYCLMLPVLRGAGSAGRGWLREFARRRARRILPPYAVVLVASMLLIGLNDDLRKTTATPWDITLPSLTFGKVISHVVMVHNWSESWRYAFDPPLWSIALEFQIYFVFALLLLPVWRRWGFGPVLAVAFAVSLVPLALGAGFASPWMLVIFVMGMIAAAIGTSPTVAIWRDRIPWRLLTAVLIVAVPVVTVLVSRLDSVNLADMLGHVAVGLATMAGLVVMSNDTVLQRPVRIGRRLLASRMPCALGYFSYSLYLVHYPIVAVITVSWIRRFDLNVPATFAVLFAICVPVSVLAGYLFHRAFERPFIKSAVGTGTDRRADIVQMDKVLSG